MKPANVMSELIENDAAGRIDLPGMHRAWLASKPNELQATNQDRERTQKGKT